VHPAAGYHAYPPPRKQRFPGPRQTCPHCGLTSETSSRTCPVCTSRFRPGMVKRIVGSLRSNR